MTFSRHNIFSQVKDSESYFIVNPLSRQADILDRDTALRLRGERLTAGEQAEFSRKGYLVEGEEENRRFRSAYIDFLEARDSSEIQIFYVPSYACNFGCSYCYQEEYEVPDAPDSGGALDAFFDFQDRFFGHRSRYLTLFGGEPLLGGEKHREKIARFLGLAKERGLETAVVTNGYLLDEYLDLFDGAAVREVQVTLDGTREVHDARRPLKKGGPTFERIAAAVDRTLDMAIPVNLRMVVDRENMSSLPGLADFSAERGWTNSPHFKTQLGRNYELHSCSADHKALYSRIELYRELYRLIEDNPGILEFHRPAYSISRFLFDNGEMPAPLFDSCPGCKTEWAFDYSGRIYSCTATVGKRDEVLGTFHPEVVLERDKVALWEERDVTVIEECIACELSLACGGGCGSAAKNRTGKLHSPDCRPVRELLEMGLSLYFEKQLIRE